VGGATKNAPNHEAGPVDALSADGPRSAPGPFAPEGVAPEEWIAKNAATPVAANVDIFQYMALMVAYLMENAALAPNDSRPPKKGITPFSVTTRSSSSSLQTARLQRTARLRLRRSVINT
jgi:hypothetical protein